MGLADWWKTSSAKASAEHYALRFNETELNGLRCGILNASAKDKLQARLQSYQKLTGTILLGCGIPLLILFVPFMAMLGYGIYLAAGALHRSPVAWIWLGFILLVSGAIVAGIIATVFKLLSFKRKIAADLQGGRTGTEEGRIDLKIVRTRDNFDIQYWMNNVHYPVLNDAVGAEINNHFLGGPNITGQSGYQTKEIYRFYYLPSSKLLLHFEPAL